MKWGPALGELLMTPFSTDRVSQRPAIWDQAGSGGGSHKQAVSLPLTASSEGGGSARGLSPQDLPPGYGLTPNTLLRWASCFFAC